MAREFDYRDTFTDFEHPDRPMWHEIVNIDLTPTPMLPRTPWPMRMGKPTESLAELHNGKCGLLHGCGKLFHDKNNGLADCIKTGAHDCKCSRWYAWLRKELKNV